MYEVMKYANSANSKKVTNIFTIKSKDRFGSFHDTWYLPTRPQVTPESAESKLILDCDHKQPDVILLNSSETFALFRGTVSGGSHVKFKTHCNTLTASSYLNSQKNLQWNQFWRKSQANLSPLFVSELSKTHFFKKCAGHSKKWGKSLFIIIYGDSGGDFTFNLLEYCNRASYFIYKQSGPLHCHREFALQMTFPLIFSKTAKWLHILDAHSQGHSEQDSTENFSKPQIWINTQRVKMYLDFAFNVKRSHYTSQGYSEQNATCYGKGLL